MFSLIDYEYPCFKNAVFSFDYTIRKTEYDTERTEFEHSGNYFQRAQYWDERDDEETLRVIKMASAYNESIIKNAELYNQYEHIVITQPYPNALCYPLEMLTRGIILKGCISIDVDDMIYFLDNTSKVMHLYMHNCDDANDVDKIYKELEEHFNAHKHSDWSNAFLFLKIPESFTTARLADATDKMATIMDLHHLLFQAEYLEEGDEHLEIAVLYGDDLDEG